MLALAAVGAIPLVLWLTDDGVAGWDQLSYQLNIIFGGFAVCLLLIAASFVASIRAVRQRKLVLLWMIPSGIILLTVLAYVVAYVVGTFWQANWL